MATTRKSRVKSEERAGYNVHGAPTAYTTEELKLLGECREMLESKLVRGTALTQPDIAGDYFMTRLAHLPHEEMHIAFLDTRHRVIATEAMFRGTIDGAEVHPREVVKAALGHNAAAVLLAHNHPSGECEPSAADRAVTARLKQALALVDVRLLDHIIVAGGKTRSMARHGDM